MASILKHLRSSTADKRPTASGLADGQIALNTASGTPAMFFKDSAGNIVKVGPAHTGTTAPNASPAGSAGNSDGELWIDESLTTRGLKYYDGATFINLTPSGTTSTVGLVELATDAETQAGTDNVRAVTPSGLQSKISDSTATTSSTTIASSTAVKSAFDLANAALPKAGGTLTGELLISPSGSLVFEGSSDDSFETTIAVTNPTADRTITFPNVTGNVVTTGDSGTVTSTMIADGTIVDADINAAAAITHSKLANITAGSVLLGNASNVPTATALSGDVTINSSGVTAISAGVIVNADINASAAIVDTKLDTISTADKVSLSALNIDGATDIGGALENGDLFVVDDGAGGTNRKAQAFRMAQLTYSGVTGDITVASGGTAAISAGVIVNADVNASAAIAGTKISPDFGSQTITTTGVVSAALGAAATPSLTFTGDLNTGIYSPGADQVAISTAGSGRLFINSSGQVFANQSQQLSNATSPTLELTGDVVINSSTTGASQTVGVNFYHLVSTSTATRAGARIESAAEAAYTAGSAASNDAGLRFYTSLDGSLAERLRITSTGALNFVGAGTAGVTQAVSFNGSAPVNSLVIDSSGRLGVGTSSPGTAATGTFSGLHVEGTATNGDLTTLLLRNPDTTANTAAKVSIEMKASSSSRRGAKITAFKEGTYADATQADIGLQLSTVVNDAYVDAVTIKQDGKVGIGTTSPATALDVQVSGGRLQVYPAVNATGTRILSVNTGNTAAVPIEISGTQIMFTNSINTPVGQFDTSGRLLVGTSSSRSVQGDHTPQIQLEGTGYASSTISVITNSNDANGSYLFLGKSRGTTVGSNTIVQNGDLLGQIRFLGSDGVGDFVQGANIEAYIDGTPGSNDLPTRLVFSTTADGASSPTERARINNAGEFSFRNTSYVFPATDNAVSLGLTGFRFSAVWAANGTIQTSDERAKADITDAALGSEFIKALRPVSYKWIEGGKRDTGKRDEDENYIYESVPGTRTHWGFIAQEVKEAVDAAGVDFGGWVLTDKDDPDSQQALRYDQFIAPLTKALQETMAELEALKAEVAALKAQ